MLTIYLGTVGEKKGQTDRLQDQSDTGSISDSAA